MEVEKLPNLVLYIFLYFKYTVVLHVVVLCYAHYIFVHMLNIIVLHISISLLLDIYVNCIFC